MLSTFAADISAVVGCGCGLIETQELWHVFNEELKDRLRQAGKDVGYKTLNGSADKFGTARPTCAAHEQGSRGMKDSVIMLHAEIVG